MSAHAESFADTDLHRDAALIEALGGSTTVARVLGLPAKTGKQTVNNWRRRGIPIAIRYQRQDVFGPPPTADQAGEVADAA